jgi:hypothetical protein
MIYYIIGRKKMKKIMTSTLLSFTLAVAGGDVPVEIEEAVVAPEVVVESSSWEHKLTLYGWLPSLNGNFNYTIPGTPGTPGEPGTPDETVSSNFIDKIDSLFMGAYEVRKDKWSFLVDGIYFKMSDSEEGTVALPPILNKPELKISTEQELDLILLNFYAGYNMMDTDNFTLDIIAGTRYLYFGVDATLAINDRSVNISPSVDFFDALVGIKGEINLSENWYVPYLFDVGGGHSDLTWQAEGSLGYRFNWGDILVTYRHIHYEKGNDTLIHDMDISGPKVGLVFHF